MQSTIPWANGGYSSRQVDNHSIEDSSKGYIQLVSTLELRRCIEAQDTRLSCVLDTRFQASPASISLDVFQLF